jgi:hypothetical protein
MSIAEMARTAAPMLTAAASALAVLIPVLRGNSGTRKRLDNIEVLLQLLLLHDEHLPLRERLNAGKRYIDLGGNGATAVYYQKLEERYRKLVGVKMEKENEA